MRLANRPKIEFGVAGDVMESVHFAEFSGFHDVTSNFELDNNTSNTPFNEIC